MASIVRVRAVCVSKLRRTCGPDIIEKNGKEYCPECVPETSRTRAVHVSECDDRAIPRTSLRLATSNTVPTVGSRGRSVDPVSQLRQTMTFNDLIEDGPGRKTYCVECFPDEPRDDVTVPTAVASVECKASNRPRDGKKYCASAYRTVYVSELFSRVRTRGHCLNPRDGKEYCDVCFPRLPRCAACRDRSIRLMTAARCALSAGETGSRAVCVSKLLAIVRTEGYHRQGR